VIDLNEIDPEDRKEVDVELSLTTDMKFAVVIDGVVVGVLKDLTVHDHFRSFRLHLNELWNEIPGLVDVIRNIGKQQVHMHYAMRFTKPKEG
jgi:hypothetical protein